MNYLVPISLINNKIATLIYYRDDIPFCFEGASIKSCIVDFYKKTCGLYFSKSDIYKIVDKKLTTIQYDNDTYYICLIKEIDLNYYDRLMLFMKNSDAYILKYEYNVQNFFSFLQLNMLIFQVYQTMKVKELKIILKNMKVKGLTKYRSKKDIISKLLKI